eukprot:1583443-Rhodomonas_salina.1
MSIVAHRHQACRRAGFYPSIYPVSTFPSRHPHLPIIQSVYAYGRTDLDSWGSSHPPPTTPATLSALVTRFSPS